MEATISNLRTYGQTKLADYILQADPEIQKTLVSYLEERGINRLFGCVENVMKRHRQFKSQGSFQHEVMPPEVLHIQDDDLSKLKDHFTPEHPVALVKKSQLSRDLLRKAENHGLELIRSGKVAYLMLAGGQGSRLGFEGPKGCFKPGLPSGKAIFQVTMERLKRIIQIAEASSLPCYIMTSIENNQPTKAFFEEHDYFGLKREQVLFFPQTFMPSFDLDGQVLLDGPAALTSNPNGNGGLFLSLQHTDMLKDMRERGVELIHVCGVDNILALPCEPAFVGLCDLAGTPVGNKCCTKAYAAEKVGVQVAMKDRSGIHPCVVEYTEITKEQAEATVRDAEGKEELLFSAGNICNHLFRREFIEHLLIDPKFDYHVAEKKIPYWDLDAGCTVRPEAPNGIKLEYFIFDAFIVADSLFAFEVERSEEFSPIKNTEGLDSAETGVRDVLNLHTKWLDKAGVRKAGDTHRYEISPLVSYAGEGLEGVTLPNPSILAAP